jgi:sec-independent protein translocase protein TatA
MGVFGLGFPELAVIAGVGILIFGPGKIAEMGKDLGGVAGSVKKASSEFQEAMSESLADADREIDERKKRKGLVVEAEQVPQEDDVPVKKAEIVDE